MTRAITLKDGIVEIRTVEGLTDVFESIASIKIAQIRGRVVNSKDFFTDLWQTYRQLRIDPHERMQAERRGKNGRTALVAVTSQGRLSGDVVAQVIDKVDKAARGLENADIIVLGNQGGAELSQRHVKVRQVFPLPEADEEFSVTDVIELVQEYSHIKVFYQTYESLRVQKVAEIELVSTIDDLRDEAGGEKTKAVDVITPSTYVFEPGLDEIADYLESLMMGVALIQVIMESKLAQYASRFNAMNAAKRRASELAGDLERQYYRTKRAESDERLKEASQILLKKGYA